MESFTKTVLIYIRQCMNDRNHDIIGTRNAGIDSIAVAYGYGSVEELKNAEPTFLANSVEEIEGILNVSFVK